MNQHHHDISNHDETDSVGRRSFDSDKDSVDEIGPGYSAPHVDSGTAPLIARQPPDVLEVETGVGLSAGRRPSLKPQKTSKAVGWRDLPRKHQLLVLTLARLSEPLAQTSLQAYMFYQLKWFDPSLPASVISGQAGILQASFTAAQFCTAMIWGRVSDAKWGGRKTVILIGLLGTLASTLGFGFSRNFYQALFFRCIGGATNGNVGVMRTMISEIVREKRYQSRAFLIMPMTFNIGVILGPILGGLLSDPATSYPNAFGHVQFFQSFPYALPNIVSGIYLIIAWLMCWLLLQETHDALQDKRDIGLMLGRKIGALVRKNKPSVAYRPLHSRDTSISTISTPSTPSTVVEMSPTASRHSADVSHPASPGRSAARNRRRYTQRLPFRRIFTRNVTFTLAAQFFLAFHVGTFNSLWFIFLSTPVYDPAADPPGGAPRPHPPLRFTGGLGLPARSVGLAMALLGAIGIALQLLLYPRLSHRLGTLRSWQCFLSLFPLAYTLLPFLSLVPSTTQPPAPKTGPAVWAAIAGVLLVQVSARTFALPAQTILVNNCTPHPSVLGTVHGLGQSVSSLARTVGPVLCGWLYGLGLSRGVVGAVFWGLAGWAALGLAVSFLVREGNGHEIWLTGDDEEEEH
ncbi:MFS general substrate transporter [Xylariaceae sp. FL0804]|nr:MFS general substrate transporter [Xylariaceae sp. FL0804]